MFVPPSAAGTSAGEGVGVEDVRIGKGGMRIGKGGKEEGFLGRLLKEEEGQEMAGGNKGEREREGPYESDSAQWRTVLADLTNGLHA